MGSGGGGAGVSTFASKRIYTEEASVVTSLISMRESGTPMLVQFPEAHGSRQYQMALLCIPHTYPEDEEDTFVRFPGMFCQRPKLPI